MKTFEKLLILSLFIASTLALGFFVKKDFKVEGFYFVNEAYMSETYYYYAIQPGQKLKTITWDANNQMVYEDFCPTASKTNPLDIKYIILTKHGAPVVVAANEILIYERYDCTNFAYYSKTGQYEARTELIDGYEVSIWSLNEVNWGFYYSIVYRVLTPIGNAGTSIFQFLEFQNTNTPSQLIVQQVDNVLKINIGAEYTYPQTSKVSFMAFKGSNYMTPVTYFFCTDDGYLVSIDPSTVSNNWSLLLEAGYGCTGMFFDIDFTNLLYIITNNNALYKVDPATKSFQKLILPEKPLLIWRTNKGNTLKSSINIITTKKHLQLCYISCTWCTGIGSDTCLQKPPCNEGCYECSPTDSSICSSCIDGYYLELTSCLKCAQRCLTCTDWYKCTSCRPH